MLEVNQYDGLNRRMVRDETGAGGSKLSFYYTGQQVIKERKFVSVPISAVETLITHGSVFGERARGKKGFLFRPIQINHFFQEVFKGIDMSDYSGDVACNRDVCVDETFQGLHEEFWENGRLRYRGIFDSGKVRKGQHVVFWGNGNLREVSNWINGVITGFLIRYNRNGTRDEEVDFQQNGVEIGSWTIRS